VKNERTVKCTTIISCGTTLNKHFQASWNQFYMLSKQTAIIFY